MYDKLEKCPSCDHPKFENYLICEDFTVTKESFALVKCANCQLVFTNPRPDSNSLSKYYKSDQYISHTDKGNSLLHLVYKLVRQYTLTKKEQLISKYSKKGTILDYGCGTGDFLSVCNKAKWKTIGYEPDADALSIAKKKSRSTFIQHLNIQEQYDVITAWHVIEHVEELTSTIKSLKKVLKPGGHMFLAVPNIKSHDAEIYKAHWAAYDVPRHLYHFSQDSFKHLVLKQKMKLVDTIPMKFDSFYVSLLSEKYKYGKPNLIRAIKSGFKSNKKAALSGEYSSLIYILQK